MGVYYGGYDGAKPDFHYRFLPVYAGSEADRYLHSADHSHHCGAYGCVLYEAVYGEHIVPGNDRGRRELTAPRSGILLTGFSMPIMKPAVATQAIFQFIAQWNNLFTPTILLTTDSKKTLPMFVQLLSSNQFRTDYGVVYVGHFLLPLPAGCGLPGAFQVYCGWCGTWRREGMMGKIYRDSGKLYK